MQEQPPSEPTSREPADRARRRPPRATFTPPAAAEQPVEPVAAEQPVQKAEPAAGAVAPSGRQRPRRPRPAPTVLFQPPDPERPLPRQPLRSSPAPSAPPATDQASPSGDTPAAGVDQPGTKQATPTKKAARARKAAPAKKATPARKAVPVDEVTPARKVTRAKKAAPALKRNATPAQATSAPQPSTAMVEAENDPVQTSGRTPESDVRALIARLRDHPGFAPELLALEAVRALGPGAAEWAQRLRARYPDAPADGLARLATRRYVRAAGAGGAAAALAGLFAPLAELASVLWTQANLVLRLAAVYGKDPAHPDRAAELLVLTLVHSDATSAQEALLAAQTTGDPVEGAWPRAAEAAWRLAAPLTAQAGGWVALRLASRLLPGAAVVAATLGDAAAADRLAARAVAAYRPSRR